MSSMPCLEGLTVFVSKRVDGDLSVQTAVASKLQALGATVVKRLSKEVTHVVYLRKLLPSATEQAQQTATLKDLYEKLAKLNPAALVVSNLWVHATADAGAKVQENDFIVPKPVDPPALPLRLPVLTPEDTSKGRRKAGLTPRRANHHTVPLPGNAFTLDLSASLFSSSQQIQQADAQGLLSRPGFLSPLGSGHADRTQPANSMLTPPTAASQGSAGKASRKRRASAPEHVLLAGSKIMRVQHTSDAPTSISRRTGRQARSASPTPAGTSVVPSTSASLSSLSLHPPTDTTMTHHTAGPSGQPETKAAEADQRPVSHTRPRRSVMWADNLTPLSSPVHGLTLSRASTPHGTAGADPEHHHGSGIGAGCSTGSDSSGGGAGSSGAAATGWLSPVAVSPQQHKSQEPYAMTEATRQRQHRRSQQGVSANPGRSGTVTPSCANTPTAATPPSGRLTRAAKRLAAAAEAQHSLPCSPLPSEPAAELSAVEGADVDAQCEPGDAGTPQVDAAPDDTHQPNITPGPVGTQMDSPVSLTFGIGPTYDDLNCDIQSSPGLHAATQPARQHQGARSSPVLWLQRTQHAGAAGACPTPSCKGPQKCGSPGITASHTSQDRLTDTSAQNQVPPGQQQPMTIKRTCPARSTAPSIRVPALLPGAAHRPGGAQSDPGYAAGTTTTSPPAVTLLPPANTGTAVSPGVAQAPLAARLLLHHRRKSSSGSLPLAPALKAPLLLKTSPLGTPHSSTSTPTLSPLQPTPADESEQPAASVAMDRTAPEGVDVTASRSSGAMAVDAQPSSTGSDHQEQVAAASVALQQLEPADGSWGGFSTAAVANQVASVLGDGSVAWGGFVTPVQSPLPKAAAADDQAVLSEPCTVPPSVVTNWDAPGVSLPSPLHSVRSRRQRAPARSKIGTQALQHASPSPLQTVHQGAEGSGVAVGPAAGSAAARSAQEAEPAHTGLGAGPDTSAAMDEDPQAGLGSPMVLIDLTYSTCNTCSPSVAVGKGSRAAPGEVPSSGGVASMAAVAGMAQVEQRQAAAVKGSAQAAGGVAGVGVGQGTGKRVMHLVAAPDRQKMQRLRQTQLVLPRLKADAGAGAAPGTGQQ